MRRRQVKYNIKGKSFQLNNINNSNRNFTNFVGQINSNNLHFKNMIKRCHFHTRQMTEYQIFLFTRLNKKSN